MPTSSPLPGQRSNLVSQRSVTVNNDKAPIRIAAQPRRLSVTLKNTTSTVFYVSYGTALADTEALRLDPGDVLYEEQFTGPIHIWAPSLGNGLNELAPCLEVYF